MTRTNKWTLHESKPDSRYFTHNGFYGISPKTVKKDGSGRGNWGKPGDEIEDLIDSGEVPPVFNKSRRGSNSRVREAKLERVQHYQV